MIQVCPICVETDTVTRSPAGDGLWEYVCSNTRAHGGEPRLWLSHANDPLEESSASGPDLAEELGLLADLPACLIAGDPWVEYGIVEHRYSQLRPDIYSELVDRYGHTRQGPKRYTASAFVAFTLARLADAGELVGRAGLATGYWAYNAKVSYWALPPAPSSKERLSYEAFAASIGIDPLA